MRKYISLLIIIAFLACTSVSSLALTFTANNSNIFESGAAAGTLAATAEFTIPSTGTMELVLTNTAGYQAKTAGDLLVALFFNVNGTAPVATSAQASHILTTDPTPSLGAGTNVSGRWAYGSGLNVYGQFNAGVSGAGLGVAWTPINGGPQNLINGGDYTIVSINGIESGKLKQENPLVEDTVFFVFTVPETITSANLSSYITGVGFQYNTTLGSTPVPEPLTLLLLGLGLVGLAGVRRYSK